MSSRSLRSVFMVASCAGAALGCYLVSLRVASERAQLEDVETKIVLAQRDMRVLQTEIGTRGRLSQLERWNAGAFALSAPAADQLLKGGFELARLQAPEHEPDFKAPVVLASAPAPEKKPALAEPETDEAGAPAAVATTPRGLLQVASYWPLSRWWPVRWPASCPPAAPNYTETRPHAPTPPHTPSLQTRGRAAAHPVKMASVDKPLKVDVHPSKLAKTVDKQPIVTAKVLTKPIRIAKADPLAPLPAHHNGNSKGIAAQR